MLLELLHADGVSPRLEMSLLLATRHNGAMGNFLCLP